MKKLSRAQMKNVMGGDVPQTGCLLICCLVPAENGSCPEGYLQGALPIETCAGAGNISCIGAYFVACTCYTGPAM